MNLRSGKCLLLSICLILSMPVQAATGDAPGKGGESSPANYINSYLKKLEVSDISQFNVTEALRPVLEKLRKDGKTDEEVRQIITEEFFSELSAPTIARLFRAFIMPEYPNAFITGEAGVGKTFLIHQLVMLFSFGIIPDYLKKALNLSEGGSNLADAPAQAFFGNTQIILLNGNLLSHSISKGAYASEEVRTQTTLLGLINEAKREFRRTDKKGLRTIFICNEAGQLPRYVHDAMKDPMDEGGFLLNSELFLRQSDPGFHVLGMTTPDEYFRLIGGDSAIQRRYPVQIDLYEPSNEQVFTVVREHADEVWRKQYPTLEISDDAIRYFIHMKKFLTWPPTAAPASVKGALNRAAGWKMHHPGEEPNRISLKDAQRFLMGGAGLTDVWFEGPNGEPPFHDLAERVQRLVVGHSVIIGKISATIKAWARSGMSRKVPVFFLGGPTGAGKDTIVAAFNNVLFGHDGRELMFSIGGKRGFGVDAIFDGPPLGNHSDNRPSLALQAMMKRGTGMLALNEAADTNIAELDKLKVIIEQAMLKPAGTDSRPRPILFPIFILGQWGEEFFNGPEYQKDNAAYKHLKQRQIDEFFLHPKNGAPPGIGMVSQALLDRAKTNGGVYVVEPTAPANYIEIVEMWAPTITRSFAETNDYQLMISPALMAAVTKVALSTEERTRSLYGIMVDMTLGAISRAIDLGLPERHAAIEVDAEGFAGGEEVVIVRQTSPTRREWRLPLHELLRSQAAIACDSSFAAPQIQGKEEP